MSANDKKPKAPAITQTSMRASGAKSAACWHDNEDELQDTTTLVAWRAECYADTVRAFEGSINFMGLLAAWEYGFDHLPDRDEGDIVDDINAASGILRDLLKLALGQCVAAGNVGKAESALRAANRYIDDIDALASEFAIHMLSSQASPDEDDKGAP